MLEKVRRAEDVLRKRREKLERDLVPAAPDSEADAGEVEPIADIRPVASADGDQDEVLVADQE